MEFGEEGALVLQLFDSSGSGLIGLDGEQRIAAVNSRAKQYLDLDEGEIEGRDLRVLKSFILSPEFWEAFEAEGDFYAIVPSRTHLLLTTVRSFPNGVWGSMGKAVFLRPYSLQREFIRMRSRLNQNITLEISSRLSSIAIASEIILQPEVRDDEGTRKRFLSSFNNDLSDLNLLIGALEETAEPLPLPTHIRFLPVDWGALVSDLVSKLRGLTQERNVSVVCDLPSMLPSPRGEYQWLALGLFDVLMFAFSQTRPLGEVSITAAEKEGALVTEISMESEGESADPWPPATVFAFPPGDPQIRKMEISELALARCVFRLHHGDLGQAEDSGGRGRPLRITLPL